MFRRLRLPGKLVLAAVPLVLALAAVSALFVQSTFAQAAEERRAADLADVLVDLRAAIDAVAAEAAPYVTSEEIDTDAAQAATDERLERLEASIEAIDAPPLARQLTVANRRLTDLRSDLVDGITAPELVASRIPASYEQVSNDLLSIASLIPAEVSNQESARALEGLAAIGRARQVARTQDRVITSELQRTADLARTVEQIRDLNLEFIGWVNVFETVASSRARTIFAQSGAPVFVGAASSQIDQLISSPAEGLRITVEDWGRLLGDRAEALATFETNLTETIGQQAETAAAAATTRAWVVMGAAAGALLLAAIMTTLISRSIVRRVRSVTERAQHVAQEQLPALVEALRDPGEDAALPSIPPIRDRGADEVGDLARSFAAMQSTLEHVAEQQLETLRKGVADMFVTLARRNRSLIDRQLALIDELEADEEDPAALADFYRLDHMATRMRRNAESLLVLAGTEPARSWRTPLGIDDVVRAAIGEIEDYRRVDVLTLEAVKLKGSVVADLSHLLSELLENATHFSPPETRVRVSGHFHEQGYLITVTDRGVGIPEARLTELNRLLDRPPIVGLALEPTLGLYVVAMLARRHGIQVRLVPGAPGISAKLLVPPSVYEISEAPEPIEPELVGATTGVPEPGRHAVGLAPSRGSGVGSLDGATRLEGRPPAPSLLPPTPSELPSRRGTDGVRTHVRSAPPAAPAQPTEEAPAQDPTQPVTHNGLPTRRPGASYAEDPDAERPVGSTPRTPESVRSRFGAFQTGLEAARRDAIEGGHE